MMINKNLFILAITGIAFTSCIGNSGNDATPVLSIQTAPVVQPLTFNKPRKLAWATVKPVAIKPSVTRLDWEKLPEQAFDTSGFRPFKYPVQETKFDYAALPAKSLDINKLPSRPLIFKSYVLPPPKLVKGAKPELKNGNLYLLGVSDDESVSGTEVTRLLRDKDGFLWMACTYGLYRFDGENLLNFFILPG